ncbi:MAG: TOBE domain-containing protein [Actinomycetales bacterium]|nr:TOBE domain-containing protein [Actinomycetales bacterium]
METHPRSEFTIGEAAALLGVSDDTVRRWAQEGRIAAHTAANGRQAIAGVELVPLLREQSAASQLAASFPAVRASARNRLTGLVTAVERDGVMAQVELQCGPFRVVSLMTREAADELGLAPGVLATASAKATVVTVELPEGAR